MKGLAIFNWHSRLQLKTKKTISTVCFGLFFLFAGIEYAVILPTLNDYLLDTFHTKQFFYGLVLSAFSLSGLLMAPIFGTWYDRTHSVKFMILFANMWEIGGNIMYFLGINEYYVLGGRLLAGVGAGVGSAVFAHIANITTEKERAAAISVLMACRQLGLLFGPGLNWGLEKCDFYIGQFPVNKFTSPGLFMAIMWCILQFVFLFIYSDVPTLNVQKKMMQASLLGVEGEEHHRGYDTIPNGNVVGANTSINDANDREDDDENSKLLNAGDEAYMQHQSHEEDAGYDTDDEKLPGFCWSLNVCLSEAVIVLAAAQFVFYFNQPGLETAVVPLTEKYLNFNELDNSIFYCICGVELLIFFIIVKFISTKVSDRWILMIGLIIETISLGLLAIFIPPSVPGDAKKNMPYFIISCVIQVSGLAFMAVSIISLFSKVVPPKIQGFSQGIRRAFGGIATIMGPLWSGSTVEKPFIMLIVMEVLFILSTLMVMLSWKTLTSRSDRTIPISPPSDIIDDDREPLLGNDDQDVTA